MQRLKSILWILMAPALAAFLFLYFLLMGSIMLLIAIGEQAKKVIAGVDEDEFLGCLFGLIVFIILYLKEKR